MASFDLIGLSDGRVIVKKPPQPPGLRPRKSKSGQIYYYLKIDPALREVPLGKNLQAALAAWQQYRIARHMRESQLSGILKIIGCFRLAEIPVRDGESQIILLKQVGALEDYFLKQGNPGLSSPMPDSRAYLEYRGANFRLRAGGEVRLFVHIWSWAARHSLVVGPCPWTSDPVTDNIRKDTQREIGDALRYYASYHTTAVAAIPQCIAGTPGGAPVISDNDALEWVRAIAKMLQDDGRKDLARAVRKLTARELRALLATSHEAGAGSGQLVLGTQRSVQLTAQRTTRSSRPAPERAANAGSGTSSDS
ncbi:hypothetical protein AB4Y40_34235 [Paraburkholderia sp. EG287B]|uniref:hypothetical protein n=1 Tax=Paraburkholderia sp. EG287B TaxID=3237010 RepID=UPI0034D20296